MFDALDFVAQLTQHTPPKRLQLIRRFGSYASRTKGRWEQMPWIAERAPEARKAAHQSDGIADDRGHEQVDPFVCPKCGANMKVIAVIDDPDVPGCILRETCVCFFAQTMPKPIVAVFRESSPLMGRFAVALRDRFFYSFKNQSKLPVRTRKRARVYEDAPQSRERLRHIGLQVTAWMDGQLAHGIAGGLSCSRMPFRSARSPCA